MKLTPFAPVVATVIIVWSVLATAQAPSTTAPVPPTLTEVQKLTLQSKAKDVKIAELTVQQAVANYKQAQADFNAALAAVQKPCYDLQDDLTFARNDKKDDCKK